MDIEFEAKEGFYIDNPVGYLEVNKVRTENTMYERNVSIDLYVVLKLGDNLHLKITFFGYFKCIKNEKSRRSAGFISMERLVAFSYILY